ncbi:MAG TPA: hypothetical protein VK416_14555 [Thermoanaerobaculia bacterium]|nr:hypothetical protein [Thermoanaerobaculia bacterium]
MHGATSGMTWFKAFLAGFFSTLLFHQGLLAVLHAAGASPRVPYSMEPTAPFGIPAVLSLAFWGGVWGIAIWLVIRRRRGSALYWILALIVGAVAPTLVALFVVLPLKGQPAAGGGNPTLVVGALLLNGVWGLGVAALMRLFR